MVAENLIYFEDLALSLGKDKKSFFHGVHRKALKTLRFQGLFLKSVPVNRKPGADSGENCDCSGETK